MARWADASHAVFVVEADRDFVRMFRIKRLLVSHHIYPNIIGQLVTVGLDFATQCHDFGTE